MKTFTPLLACAALLLTAFVPHGFSASQVTMDLTGQVIRSGSTISLSSTDSIDHAPIYYYSISGTVLGSGTLALLTGTGTSLANALGEADPAAEAYLSGDVFDPSTKFPFTCVNKTEKGFLSIQLSPEISGTIYGSILLKAGIDKNGICYAKLGRPAFSFLVPFLDRKPVTDKGDSLTFLDGQVTVQTTPFGGPPQPDLSLDDYGQLIGLGITGTNSLADGASGIGKEVKKGHSLVYPILLQNVGSAADSFTVTATQYDPAFSQEFIYKGKNVTAAVTSPAGLTIPAAVGATTQTLAPGAVAEIIWVIKNKSASFGFFSEAVVTASSNTTPANVDSVEVTAIGGR